jgi:hypothetical protein
MRKHILALVAICLFLSGCAPNNIGEDTVSKEDRSSWIQSQRSQDKLLCDKIENNNFHDNCLENIAVNTNDISLCDKVFGIKDFCISNVARKLNKPVFCEDIVDDNRKDNCFRGVAVDYRDAYLCSRIASQKTRDGCFKEIGVATSDATMCESVEEDADARDNCFYSVAVYTKEPIHCSSIEGDDELRDTCFSVLARQSLDLTLCKRILGEDKNECTKQVAVLNYDLDSCEGLPEDLRDRCVDDILANCAIKRKNSPENLPYYCQDNVLTPGGSPTSYT